jgi:hypothetical protein
VEPVEGQQRDRQRHQRDDADNMRGQQVIEGEQETRHACQRRGGKEQRRHSARATAGEHTHQHDHAGGNRHQAYDHMQCRES